MSDERFSTQPSLAQPAPYNVNVALTRAPDGTQLVVLALDSVNGQSVYFLTPDHAIQVGEGLAATAAQAQLTTGLVIPRAPIPPDVLP